MTNIMNRQDASKVDQWVCDTLGLKWIDKDVDAIDDDGNEYEIKSCLPYIPHIVRGKQYLRTGMFALFDKDLEDDDLNLIFVLKLNGHPHILAQAKAKDVRQIINSNHESHKISWFDIDRHFGGEQRLYR